MPLREDLHDFPGLSHTAFQHPLDKQAIAALEKVPLLPQVTAKFSEIWSEKFIRVMQTSSSLRVSARQFPTLYRDYERMAHVLDLRELPTLYLRTSPEINAYAMGISDYFIVVTTGLIELMDEDELLAVIAHEMGHVKCQHMLYTTMVSFLTMFGSAVLDKLLPGIAQFASMGIQLALLEWYRKAEFSSDRAALLATQNEPAVSNMLAKLAGWSSDLPAEFNLDEVKRQAQDYEELDDTSVLNKVIKLAVLLQQSHPYPVVRVAEIAKWADSDGYQRILRGDYARLHEPSPDRQTPPQQGTPQANAERFCPACGAKISEAARFCASCGADIGATRPS